MREKRRPRDVCAAGRKKTCAYAQGEGGNTAAANPNQSLLLKEKAGVRFGRTVRRFTGGRRFP